MQGYNLPFDHISHSQISMYRRCPEQYRRRYIEGEKIPPGVSLLKGGAVHEGIKFNNRQKIETYEDLPGNQIIDCSVAGFEKRVGEEGYILTKDEQSRGAKIVLGEAKDRVAYMSGFYREEMAPAIQPTLAEERIMVNLPDIPPVNMVLDCIDDKKRIRDSKLSKRKKSEKDVEGSMQLTLYAIAYRVLTGELPDAVIFDVLIDKKNPEYQVLSSTRDMEDFRVGLEIVKAVIEGISKGSFPPAAEGSWACDPRYCGYYHTCRFVKKSA